MSLHYVLPVAVVVNANKTSSCSYEIEDDVDDSEIDCHERYIKMYGFACSYVGYLGFHNISSSGGRQSATSVNCVVNGAHTNM